MRIALRSYSEKFHEDWRPWFAWRPVFAGNCIVWLETVETRYDNQMYGGEWEYRIKEGDDI